MLATVFCHFYSVHRDVLRRLGALAVLSDGDRRHARDSATPVAIRSSASCSGAPGLDDARLNDTLQALTSFAFVDELAGPDRTPDDVAGEVAALVCAGRPTPGSERRVSARKSA